MVPRLLLAATLGVLLVTLPGVLRFDGGPHAQQGSSDVAIDSDDIGGVVAGPTGRKPVSG
jgi:hypothetical protein